MTLSLNLNDLKPKKALLIGDFMLDRYTLGAVDRISPEAPVCVLQVQEEKSQPGGAGNAVLNLISLGMQVTACGRIGKDNAGEELLKALKEQGINTDGMICDPNYITPVKNRLIANQQQLVRVDYEKVSPLKESLKAKIEAQFDTLFKGVDVVALSDYGKGFLTSDLLCSVIKEANRRDIPLIVDPKGADYSKYRGATLIKPNLTEALQASGLDKGSSLDDIAKRLLVKTAVQALLITRSSAGISLFADNTRLDFPAQVREVKDVTGAGDTVLAIITLSLANRIKLPTAIHLANIAAGIAVERVGCQQVTLTELQKRLKESSSQLNSSL